MPEMTKERKGQIALAILCYRLNKDGLNIRHNDIRELGNLSKETGIPIAELKEFGKILYNEFMEKFMNS